MHSLKLLDILPRNSRISVQDLCSGTVMTVTFKVEVNQPLSSEINVGCFREVCSDLCDVPMS